MTWGVRFKGKGSHCQEFLIPKTRAPFGSLHTIVRIIFCGGPSLETTIYGSASSIRTQFLSA